MSAKKIISEERLLEVSIYDDKYTLCLESDGHLHCLRYGETWRDLSGDGMVLALVQEVAKLREKLNKAQQPSKLRRVDSFGVYRQQQSVALR